MTQYGRTERIKRRLIMFETFWRRHYHSGVTGSFHGDMAHAFAAIAEDPDVKFYPEVVRSLWTAVRIHMDIERSPWYTGGRKWFCERFGTEAERLVATEPPPYPGCDVDRICAHGNPWGGDCPHCDGYNRPKNL